jgi:hypothetical protein
MKAGPIRLDFASSGPRTPLLGWTLLVSGSLLLAGAGVLIGDSLVRQAEVQAELDKLAAARSTPRPRPVVKPGEEARLAAQRLAQRQVSRALTQPWADLLDALEVKPQDSVALLAVEPSGSKRTVRITAEARDERAMLEHLEMLQKEPRLSDVSLVSHQKQLQLPGTPWRYQIQGAW